MPHDGPTDPPVASPSSGDAQRENDKRADGDEQPEEIGRPENDASRLENDVRPHRDAQGAEPVPPEIPVPGALSRDLAAQWLTKWRWYTRPQRPWNRARLQVELARREAFARGRLNGEILTMLRDGRLELGPQTFFEPGVWMTAGPNGRIRIGGGTFLNQGVMIAAEQLVEIGEHCMAANGCLISDGSHRFDDPEKPVPWQGFTTKGPTRIGDNVWLGANVVVTSGVSIGRRSVIGANSVVTQDIPPFSIAAGAPAKVIKTIEHPGP